MAELKRYGPFLFISLFAGLYIYYMIQVLSFIQKNKKKKAIWCSLKQALRISLNHCVKYRQPLEIQDHKNNVQLLLKTYTRIFTHIYTYICFWKNSQIFYIKKSQIPIAYHTFKRFYYNQYVRYIFPRRSMFLLVFRLQIKTNLSNFLMLLVVSTYRIQCFLTYRESK